MVAHLLIQDVHNLIDDFVRAVVAEGAQQMIMSLHLAALAAVPVGHPPGTQLLQAGRVSSIH